MKSNNIDHFLRKKLADDQSSVQDDWDQISTRVSFMNFFKFGLRHYNFYYTLAIIASFLGIMSAVLAFNFNQTYVAEHKNKPGQQKATDKKGSSVSISKKSNYNSFNGTERVTAHKTLLASPSQHFEAIENIETEEVFSSIEHAKSELQFTEKVEYRLLALENKNPEILGSYQSVKIKERLNQAYSPVYWFVDIYSQPIFSDAIMISSGNNNLNFESANTKQSYGISVGVMKNKFRFQTGLQFIVLSKNFSNSFVKNYVVQEKSYEVYTSVVYGLESGKVLKSITDSVLVKSEKVVRNNYLFNHLNSYKFLQIPVLFGYKQRYHKLAFVAKGGLIFDLYKSAKGSLNTSDQSVNLNKVPFYKSYFTIYSSVGIYYKLNPIMSIFFEPNFRVNLSGKNTENAMSIETNKFSSGVKVGLEFDF